VKEKGHILRRATATPEVMLNCFAAVPRGVEEIAANELAALGVAGATVTRGGVTFTTDRSGLYRANLWLRTASRVLVNLLTFSCKSPQELYDGVRSIEWDKLITPDMTLAVDSTLRDSSITHSGFTALKTKDAIVDCIRDKCGRRPSVNPASPDVRVNVRLFRDECTVSLDSSGDALDRRGYRLERNEAPLRETLAAAVVSLTGWDGCTPFVDPMCGSGTVPIEAAMVAARMPPGLRRSFGFERWLDFDARLWERIRKKAESGLRELPLGLVCGLDQDARALSLARRNAEAAGFSNQLHFFHAELDQFRPEGDRGVVVMNPPYGKRMGDEEELKELYCRIGDVMKQRCRGWTGFVLTGNTELAKYVGLKASRRFVLFNGAIECRLLRYELY